MWKCRECGTVYRTDEEDCDCGGEIKRVLDDDDIEDCIIEEDEDAIADALDFDDDFGIAFDVDDVELEGDEE